MSKIKHILQMVAFLILDGILQAKRARASDKAAKTLLRKHREATLEDAALWDSNTGEPWNESARELCRRWGEQHLLDEHPVAQQPGDPK